MDKVICLDHIFSTTKMLTQEKPTLENKPTDQFDSVLFLSKSSGRKGEGGLRTKGYFKSSYENKPLISIITVVFNGEKYLEQTIQSVINQSYSNVEYIIIDGGSTDRTLEIIKKYEGQIDYWVSEKDSGISNAFNKAITLCTGEYIQTLNAGDFLINQDVLLKILPTLMENEAVVAYQSRTDRGNNFPYYPDQYTPIKPKNAIQALKSAMISHQGAFIQRDVYRKIGLYSEEFKIRMDLELFVRLQQQFRVRCINEPIVIYDTSGISSNLFNRLAFKMEEYKVMNIYYKNLMYKVVFYIELPLYLVKKTLAHFYYKFRK